MVSKLCLPMSV